MNDYRHLFSWETLGFEPTLTGTGSRHYRPHQRKITGKHRGDPGMTLWIHKNAHTWLKDLAGHKPFHPLPDITEMSVLIRHPYDRWKSGVLQYAIMNPDKKEFILDSIKDGHIIFDEHTLPQCCFVKFEALTTSHLSWKEIPEWSFFRVPNHLQQWNNHWRVTDDLPPPVNVGIRDRAKLEIFADLDIAITRKTINQIKEVYHDDYVLWELTEGKALFTNNLL